MDAACTFGVVLLLVGTVASVGTVNAAVAPGEPSTPGLLSRLHRHAVTGGLPFALASLLCFLAAVILVAVAC